MFQNEDIGKLVLRVAIGVLMLFHGVHKMQHGIGFLDMALSTNGLPAFLAYGVYLGEVLAPIMLIIGYQVRIGAALIIATMAVAIYVAHSGDIFKVTFVGAWQIELPMFYLLASTAVLFLGAGRYVLVRKF
ncbi:MAG: GntR family transcriptional regulator [Sulfuricurvum sp. PC08-66]|nr:MAG: GntR family transcriptional regulator [Sulfuricurvum sp. PC08-66]